VTKYQLVYHVMYFTSSDQQILKQGVLTKRSQGKSRSRSLITNYKSRLFILTPTELSYYEGTIEKKGKQKGSIPLSKIKVIEEVDDNALDKKFCFQIQHGDLTLFVITSSDEERQDWIGSIRYEISQQNRLLLENFHSGIFNNGSWSCCKATKHARGCKKTFFAEATAIDESSMNMDYLDRKLPPIPNGDTDEGAKSKTEDKVVALFNFKALQAGDLSLTKDSVYTILEYYQAHWWKARDAMGNEGFIPSNYVRRDVGLEGQKWFHGDLSRQETEEVLKAEWKDGVFLVKNSSRPGMYTLSLSFQGAVKHYHIKLTEDKKYFVSQRHSFDTIIELVEYHKRNCAGLITRLRVPYTNQGNGPSTPALGHDIFEIVRSEITFGRQLGSGQFGTVYEGVWKGNQRIAIKTMKPGSMEDDDFIEEAKSMSNFYHKNLVRLFGVCSLIKPLCIVTEYMCNGSLLEYLRNNRMLLSQTNMLLSMVFQVICAMQYLENISFIHRDLAARNCLVGERNLVKVADFGLARHVLDDEYTASEGTKFPIKWAAPEVIEFTRFSSKSDVWAYGILCWEVFSGGKSPYPGRNNAQVATDVISGYRMDRPASCPIEVFDIVSRCWEMSQESRPSFKELYSEFELLVEDYTE